MRKRLSYTSFSLYAGKEGCPYRWKRQFVDQEDQPQDNFVRGVFGMVMGRFFEDFYNDNLYRSRDAVSIMVNKADAYISKVESEKGSNINWINEWGIARVDVFDEIVAAIPQMVKTIQQHKLLGGYAEAEVELGGWAGEWELYGRADLVFKRGGQTFIVDGKGSKHGSKYSDPDQLLFYALLWFTEYQTLPDHVGWMLFRFEPAKAVEWIEVTREAVGKLRNEVVKALAGIEAGQFEATPSTKSCQYCPYQDDCIAKDEWKLANQKKRPPKTLGSTDIMDLTL